MLVFATPATTHNGPAFSTPLPDKLSGYLSPNQTPVEEDIGQVFSETKLYEKYFAPLSLPNRKRRRSRPSTPPMPVPIPSSSAAIFDLFAMDDDAPATEEIVLQKTPRIILQIPRRLLSRAETIQLILDASSLVVESLNSKTKEAEFVRGMRRLAKICMLSYGTSNVSSVMSHPQLTPAIKMYLLGMFPEIRVTVPLSLPLTFNELDRFIGQLENRKLYILGKLADEEVLLTMSGDVPVREGVEEFFEGRVVVDFGDEQSDGIVLGHVRDTATALIALSDMRLILYNIPDALFEPWKGLRHHKSAFFATKGNEINLVYVELKYVHVVEEVL